MNFKFMSKWLTNFKRLYTRHTINRPYTSSFKLNHLLSTLEYSKRVTTLQLYHGPHIIYEARIFAIRRLIMSNLRITDEDNIYAWWTLADTSMPNVLMDTEEERFIKEHQDYALATCSTNPFEATLFTLAYYNVIGCEDVMRLLNVFKAEDELMGAESLLNPKKSERFLAETRNRFILTQHQ